MLKYFWASLLVLWLSLFFIQPVIKATEIDSSLLFTDEFNTKEFIDTEKTTAIVDVSKGEILLPGSKKSQSFDVHQEGMIVQDGDQLVLYSRLDDGTFIKESSVTDEQAVAVSMSQNGFAHYVLRSDGSVIKMEYAENGMIENPVARLTGFTSATTISVLDDVVVIGDLNKITELQETENALQIVDSISIDGVLDHLSIGPTYELVTVKDNDVHVYRYAENGYVQSPGESLSGMSVAEIGDEDIFAGIDNNGKIQVKFIDTGTVLSFSHKNAVGLRINNNSLYIRDHNSITEYVFDGERFVKANVINGLSEVQTKYLSPRNYQSILITLPKPIQRFGITAEMDLPEKTAITFEISPDGVNFFPFENGQIDLGEEIEQVVIKAVLTNNNNYDLTPILKNVSLFDRTLTIEMLETTRIVRDPGDNPVLPTEEPVRIWGGYNFDVRVTAYGAKKVTIVFSNGDSFPLVEEEPNIFIGTYHFLEDEIGNMDVLVIASDSANEVESPFLAHYILVDNIRNNYRVYDTR